jgi:hypothetical protein
MANSGGNHIMHIPPYHKKVTWQRFFVGMLFGGVIAYCTLIYMYGEMYEQLLKENREYRTELTELRDLNEALLQDKKDLNEKSKEPLTVETIEINIANKNEYRLDRLIVHDLEEMVKKEIKHIIGRDISIIDKSDDLLISSIENKNFTVDEFTYSFKVEKLAIISQTVKLTLHAELAD